jgi:tRNA-uridine 2-sulfurtransferase
MGHERIVVGLSGGVDSAVAALLLKRAGHEIVGLFMKNWEDDDDERYCSTRQDLVDCASVADVIGIDLEVVNFAVEYRERVFASFLSEYAAGRTPNPDVLCNAEIKFKAFIDHAVGLGARHIATGHYARVRRQEAAASRQGPPAAGAGCIGLLWGVGESKDQSYFLHRLTQQQLDRVLFPVGGLKKSEVRRIARESGLPVHAKKDSTGICFIGERPFREFLNRYLPRTPGAMRTPEGRIVGEHIGLAFYTVGQRKGLGLGGMKGGELHAWYVAGKDMARNELIVVQGHDHPSLLNRRLRAAGLAWVSGHPPAPDLRCTAKTRYRQKDAACTVTGVSEASLELEFEVPQWAVTPGQSAVLYDGEVCLGGGVIQ